MPPRLGTLALGASTTAWNDTTLAAADNERLQTARRHSQQAEVYAAERSARSVDEFYAAALTSWAAHQSSASDSAAVAAWRLYHDCVGRLIHEAREHRRLSPTGGLIVERAGVRQVIPVEFHGFAWAPEDFHEWHVVGSYAHRAIQEHKTNEGFGVPLVIVRHQPSGGRHEVDFLPPSATFAATAVLKPDGSALVLCNPLQVNFVETGGARRVLARDLSASIVYRLHFYEQSWLEGFIRPDRADEAAELECMEPYQAEKIPLILIHGLLSSPDAWGAVHNELVGSPDLSDTYQVWTFRYGTGAPFVRSASALRSQLDQVQSHFDPEASNPTLHRAVLVGHSMGGLIAKLMVTHSGEVVWDSVANLPLERVATDEATRAKLADRFYFDPHPMVERVIFLATPHQGSAVAGRAAGKVAGALVTQSEPEYEQLMRDNVGGFKGTVDRRLPTSIDLLDPNQPFLATISSLPVSRSVTLHSIIGEGRGPLHLRNSDGLVPIDSARYPGVESERMISATHSGILRHPEAIEELKRILRRHVAPNHVGPTSELAAP